MTVNLHISVFALSMGGDHGHGKMSMPDWRQWKTAGTPMDLTEQRLAARGLKDPWARSVKVSTHDIYMMCLFLLPDRAL